MNIFEMKKICPFISTPDQLKHCIGSDCALFEMGKNECKIGIINRNIETVAKNTK